METLLKEIRDTSISLLKQLDDNCQDNPSKSQIDGYVERTHELLHYISMKFFNRTMLEELKRNKNNLSRYISTLKKATLKKCNWCGKESNNLFIGICEECNDKTPEELQAEECD